MRVLLIDNYDSFTYNLLHYLEAYAEVTVRRNDDLENVLLEEFSGVVISPGPGLPEGANDLLNFMGSISSAMPILGVCLGMQAMLELSGNPITNLNEIVHGKPSRCEQTLDNELLKGCGEQFQVGRYHSWGIMSVNINDTYVPLAELENGILMAIKHHSNPWYGVQFHPESILTPDGKKIVKNWIDIATRY